VRIVFFSEAYDPQVNGVVGTQKKLTRYLRSRGHQVLLVVPRYTCNPPHADTVELRALPFPLYPEMRVILPHWRFHRREFARVEAFKPDLVHLLTPGVLAYFGQRWATANGCPVVGSYETDIIRYLNYYGFGKFKSHAWRYFHWLFNNCKCTYAPSQDTKQFLEANGIPRVHVFERGVDCEQFHPSKRCEATRKSFGVEPDGVLILYVGRLSKEKSLELLLRCFVQCSGKYPQTRLVVTGDGPVRRTLVRKFSHPGITFTGWRMGEELATILASADIFAFPSTTETLGLASLESMASGVPVLGMNAGGMRDSVEHRRTGLLANSIEEFDAFLRLLIEDSSLRTELGLNGRRYAEGKSWARAFENLENSYHKVLAGMT